MSESLIAESVVQGALSGTLATMLMYGVTCMQTFHYWQAYEHDSKILKSVVAFIWILETAHTALSVHFVEYYLIIHFGELAPLASAVWSMGVRASIDKNFPADLNLFRQATCIIGFIIGYVANLCFIWRISRLGQNRWIAVFFAIVATVRCGFGLVNCVLSFMYPGWVVFRARIFTIMVAAQVLSALVDGRISVSLTLRQSQLVALRTDGIIKRLQLYSINTGAIGSLFAVLALIVFLVSPTTTAFIAFIQVQGKFYATSLLASLNARKSTLKKIEQSVPSADGVVLPLFGAARPNPSSRYMQSIEVQKSVTVEIYGDGLDPEKESDETRF
ncbi:hypothetical protein DEU56DRAFT_925361 [Suillus clintonianus]|uniref:uncharacterized protein n=1 Tax=Suillus clintonianus TaxID=1904413 RepID=UPI001B88461A|nr:uncharacterized protein DEU56DRAFT_925361 [Suillus clintonianus]KAG2122926.1 hypothetical protein DEU56DRAFT_925361 [Suillus clintonianus]